MKGNNVDNEDQSYSMKPKNIKLIKWVDKMWMTRTIARSIARSTARLKGMKVDDRADKGG